MSKASGRRCCPAIAAARSKLDSICLVIRLPATSREGFPASISSTSAIPALRQADAGQGEPVIFLVEMEILAKLNLIRPIGSVLEISAGQLHANSQGAEILSKFNRPRLPLQSGFKFLYNLHRPGIISLRLKDMRQG